MALFGSNPENFASVIQSLKHCEFTFLSDVFGLLSSRKFATMATWRNHFSLWQPRTLEKIVPDCRFHPRFHRQNLAASRNPNSLTQGEKTIGRDGTGLSETVGLDDGIEVPYLATITDLFLTYRS